MCLRKDKGAETHKDTSEEANTKRPTPMPCKKVAGMAQPHIHDRYRNSAKRSSLPDFPIMIGVPKIFPIRESNPGLVGAFTNESDIY